MTQQKKLHLTFAIVLTLVMALAFVLPFAARQQAFAAAPVVEDRESWTNPYSGTYYDNLNTDLTGTSFRKELANLITTTHTHLTSYDSLAQHYLKTDYDPNKSGNLIMFYTGTSVKWPGNFSGVINREHVWPKNAGKAFPEKTGPGGDLQHIRPCDNSLNSTRGNKSYDELSPNASGVKVAAENGSTSYGKAPDGLCYTNSTFFYPAKGYRGATARILFYFQTRWGDTYSLTFVDSAGSNKTIGKISTLLKWHLEEPPTDQEIRRNNEAAKIQGNRNPFIDHPEFAEMIYCNDGNSYNTALKQVVAQYGSYLEQTDVPQPESITLSCGDITLNMGESTNVTATVLPAGASQSVTWKSNKTVVATAENGVITAKSAGEAEITVSSAVNSAVKTTFKVTVTQPEPPKLQSLSVSPSPLSLTKGATRQLTVTATPSGASNSVTWSSLDGSVATVSSTGLVSAVGVGTTTITATSTADESISATCVVTVTDNSEKPDPVLQKLEISPSSVALKVNRMTTLTVTATPSGASNSVTWDSDNKAVATVSPDGVVTAHSAGTATITATSTVDPQVTATVTVTVTEDAVPDPPDPPDPPVGDQTDTSAFESALDAIASKTDLSERYNAIKAAIDEYLKLNDQAKQSVAEKYALLQQYVSDYNQQAEQINDQFAEASSVAAGAATLSIAAVLLAIAAIVLSKMGR